jgi:hypothetical protein
MKLLMAYSDCHLGVEKFSGDELNERNWHSNIAFMAAEAASADENDSTVSLLCSNMTSLFGAEDWGAARHMIIVFKCLNVELFQAYYTNQKQHTLVAPISRLNHETQGTCPGHQL